MDQRRRLYVLWWVAAAVALSSAALPALTKGSSHNRGAASLTQTVTLVPEADATFYVEDPIIGGTKTIRGKEYYLIAGQDPSRLETSVTRAAAEPLIKFPVGGLRDQGIRGRNVLDAKLTLWQPDELGWGTIELIARPLATSFPELNFARTPDAWMPTVSGFDSSYQIGQVHRVGLKAREFDVTSMVRAWLDATIENHGLVLTRPRPYSYHNSSHVAIPYHSREAALAEFPDIQDHDRGRAPTLTVRYTTVTLTVPREP